MKDIPIPRFLVKKNLPFKENPLIKGDVIDSNNPCLKFIDVENAEYFERIAVGKFNKGDEILYKTNNYDKFEFYVIVQDFMNSQYRIQNVKTHLFSTITDKTKFVVIPTKFWFVNSNGSICTDFEERDGINVQGLRFKKQIGNYFLTKEEADKNKMKLIIF